MARGLDPFGSRRRDIPTVALRQCVFLISSFSLISVITHSQTLIWFALPITEAAAFAVACGLNRRFRMDMGL